MKPNFVFILYFFSALLSGRNNQMVVFLGCYDFNCVAASWVQGINAIGVTPFDVVMKKAPQIMWRNFLEATSDEVVIGLHYMLCKGWMMFSQMSQAVDICVKSDELMVIFFRASLFSVRMSVPTYGYLYFANFFF
jgi:hypothetical protein